MANLKRFLSIDTFVTYGGNFLKVHHRFPLTLLSSFLATAFIIYSIYNDDDRVFQKLQPSIFNFYLGIPLFLAVEISKKRKWINPIFSYSLAFVILIAYFFFAEPQTVFGENKSFYFRTITLGLIFHLAVSVIPFLKTKGSNGFWQFNKSLFIAILTAFLYSITLFGGLSLALLAIENLFEVSIPDKSYGYLFVLINLYINTTLFLSHLPSLEEIDQDSSYPKGLKLFTQYVLLPLVGIYLLILLGYETKIILHWNLPKGWVSYLVLASAIFGILAFLLLYPLKNSSSWIRRYNTLYYWILLPLILLMFVAIYVRINQYGVTEPRYYVAILSVWLLFISLYFILSSKDDIRIIPLSLVIIGLISAYGPFSSFEVAKRNQTKRFMELLTKHNLIQHGKLTSSGGISLNARESEVFSSSLEHLSESEPEIMIDLLEGELADKFRTSDLHTRQFLVRTHLDFKETKINQSQSISINRKKSLIENAYSAHYIIEVNTFGKIWKEDANLDEMKVTLKQSKSMNLIVSIEKEELLFDYSSIQEQGSSPETNEVSYRATSKSWKAVLVIDSFYRSSEQDEGSMSGKIYLIKKI